MKKILKCYILIKIILCGCLIQAFSQRVCTPVFSSSQVGDELNFTTEQSPPWEYYAEEFICSGTTSLNTKNLIVSNEFVINKGKAYPLYLSYDVSFSNTGFPRCAIIDRSMNFIVVSSSNVSKGLFLINLADKNFIPFNIVFYVVSDKNKNVIPKTLSELFAINEKVSGNFSFTVKATFEEPKPPPPPTPVLVFDPEPDPGPFSTDQNSIRTRTYTNNTGSAYIEHIQYFDGLGRPIQTVQVGITPSKKNLVTIQQYDGFDRASRLWQPAVMDNNNAGTYTASATVIEKAKQTYDNDLKPYSFPAYEYSPLNRITEQYGSGDDWHKNRKGVKTEYLTNIGTTGALSCVLFSVSGTGVSTKVVRNNFYGDAQLFVTKTTDEDGNISYQFKDKLGQTALTRQILNGTNVDTYYVYDDFGNLCFVLPPLAADGLTNGTWDEANSSPVKLYAYIYRYDGRNRCIQKKLPGCEPIYYVYDGTDRLIFTQDGEQRKKSPQEWTFSIPDAFGRVVLTGTCRNAITYSTNPLNTTVVKGTYNTSRSNLANSYTISGVALTSPVYLTANYYDSYAFMGIPEVPNNADMQYNAEPGYATRYTGSYKGLLTGTATAQMNPDGTVSSVYLYSVMYYDNRNRLIQTKGNNPLAGGLEKEYIAYDFMNNPTGKKHIHSATGKTTQTEVYINTYDHAERLTKTTHQLNGGTIVNLAENTYDELGRLKTNKKGGLANLNTTYAYNIRSWIKSVSAPSLTETLYYNESYGGSAKLYNGNLSAMNWTAAGDKNRGYAFIYDNLSRLYSANYLENGAANTNYKIAYSYDKHGNLLTLQRYGKTTATTYGLIDNMTANTITYTGNQLLKVEDAVANIPLAESADFKNYSNVATEYVYNANGAMTKDLNKGISDIQYNSLNLPRLMDIKSPVAEARNEYTYSASGQKLKAVQKWNPNYSTAPVIGSAVNTSLLTQSKKTEYIGNMIYENDALKRILIDGGYIDGGVYYYYQTDHQGNNRVILNASGSMMQLNHYYPFGAAFAETPITQQGVQPYKYNGKELDPMSGLNLYDYSARYYDPAIARFTTMDPLAELRPNESPYSFAGNNPIRNTDPDGRYWVSSGDSAYAAQLQQEMTNQRNSIQRDFDRLNSNIAKNQAKGKDVSKDQANAAEMKANIDNLNAGITELGDMGETKDQGFTFKTIDGNVGNTDKNEDGVIVMTIAGNGDVANGIHESSHGYDLWTEGRPKINDPLGQDVKAYQRQFSFDPKSMPLSDFGRATSLQSITPKWIFGISSNGEYPYIKFANPHRNPQEFLKMLKHLK